MGDKIPIGRFAARLGIGRETLRHYERMGLIAPQRDERNGYRFYSEYDALNILHMRLMRSYELPLQQIQKRQDFWSLTDQEGDLARYEAYLEAELAALREKRERIHRMRGFLREAMEKKGTFWEAELNGLYKLLVTGRADHSSADAAKIIQNWESRFLTTDIGWHIFREDIRREGVIPVSLSLTVLDEYVDSMGYDLRPPVFHFPAGPSVRTIVCTKDPFSLSYATLEPFMAYLERKGYRLLSDLTGRYSGCEYMEGVPYYYFTLRGIVEEAEKRN